MQCPTPRPDPANMDVFALQRNIVDSFRPCADLADISRATQPRADASGRDAGGMNCAAVAWALAQDVSSASASRLLIEIARRSAGGRCASTQIDLGRACKLSERQTRTLIASLIDDGVVTRQRQGGVGKGRGPDAYEMVGYVETVHSEQPAISAGSQEATGSDAQVAATGNGQSSPEATVATGSFDRQILPEAATGNGSPTPPKNITPISQEETLPEKLEPSGEGGPGGAFALNGDELAKPRRVRRKSHPKFVASDNTLPRELTPEMAAIAAEAKMLNGTRSEQFVQWRRYHIREETVMTFPARSWQTWVNNWRNRQQGAHAKGKRQITLGDGRVAYAKRHQPTMRA